MQVDDSVAKTGAQLVPARAVWQGAREKAGVVHAPVGKVSFAADRLIANAHALMETIVKAKPAAAKGKYLRSVTMSSTMGPGVAIDASHVDQLVQH